MAMCKENNNFKVMCKGIADHSTCLSKECKWVPTDPRTAREKADCTLKVFQYLINNDVASLKLWYDQAFLLLSQCLPKDEFVNTMECMIKLAGLTGITQDEYKIVYNTVRQLQTEEGPAWDFFYSINPVGPDARIQAICALALSSTSYGYCHATNFNPTALPGFGDSQSGGSASSTTPSRVPTAEDVSPTPIKTPEQGPVRDPVPSPSPRPRSERSNADAMTVLSAFYRCICYKMVLMMSLGLLLVVA